MGYWDESGRLPRGLRREAPPLLFLLILQTLLTKTGIEGFGIIEEPIAIVKIWLAILLQLLNALSMVLLGFVDLLLTDELHG